MLECIEFGDCKVKTIQIGNEWFVVVEYSGMALSVGSDNLSFQEKKKILSLTMAPSW